MIINYGLGLIKNRKKDLSKFLNSCIYSHSVLTSISDIMWGSESPLSAALKFWQIIRLWFTVSLIVNGSNQDDARACVVVKVLVKELQVVKVWEQKCWVRIQLRHISRLNEINGNVLRCSMLALPPAFVHFKAWDVDVGGCVQKPFQETTATPNACYLPIFGASSFNHWKALSNACKGSIVSSNARMDYPYERLFGNFNLLGKFLIFKVI